jgi:transposase
MPRRDFTHSLQLPELKIINDYRANKNTLIFEAVKLSEFEVCPKCATPSKTVYDHISVWIKDTKT